MQFYLQKLKKAKEKEKNFLPQTLIVITLSLKPDVVDL